MHSWFIITTKNSSGAVDVASISTSMTAANADTTDETHITVGRAFNSYYCGVNNASQLAAESMNSVLDNRWRYHDENHKKKVDEPVLKKGYGTGQLEIQELSEIVTMCDYLDGVS